ncbi:MAG: hypothetical protein ACRD40_15800, partial [Candidatus Acidiferrales bacterium]
MKRVVVLLASLVFMAVCAGQEQQDQIGTPPDGTTYTVVTSKEMNKADSTDCGFNDVSAPNQGVFRQELREYKQYKDGKVVRTWRDTEEVFLRCYEP